MLGSDSPRDYENAAVTGEFNYQGGERKTFYSRFPFEQETTFGNSGIWMTSEHFGPLVEGEDDDLETRATGPTLQALELREAFRANVGYFWYGRYAGALLHFFPVALAACQSWAYPAARMPRPRAEPPA